MSADTESDKAPQFLQGRDAADLRALLAHSLSDHDVNAIAVVLFSHLLVEQGLNNLLHAWLAQDAPRHEDVDRTNAELDALSQSIAKMDFFKKFSLLDPFVKSRFPDEWKQLPKINDLRVNLFHGKKPFTELTYKGMPLTAEPAVRQVFLDAQWFRKRVYEIDELLNLPHATLQRALEKLREHNIDLW